jgi:hypothetical protein
LSRFFENRFFGVQVPCSSSPSLAFGGFMSAASFAFAPLPSSVVRSARASFAPWAGSALGVSFRPSRRAFSGFVAVVRFSSAAAAGRFSGSWGRRLVPFVRFCAVRPAPLAVGGASSWVVSVPVAAPPAPVGRGRASRALAAAFAAAAARPAP